MGKFKKGNVQQGAKLANAETNKKLKPGQKKGGVQNGVSKINSKKHAVKLPANIKEQVKNQKNKKVLTENGNLNQIVTVKETGNKNKNGKLPIGGLQNGQGKAGKKGLKNVSPQNKAKHNIPVSKPEIKNKEKAGPENKVKQQVGPVPKLPLAPNPKKKGKKQVPLPQKGPVIAPTTATKEKSKTTLKKKQNRTPEESETTLKKKQNRAPEGSETTLKKKQNRAPEGSETTLKKKQNRAPEGSEAQIKEEQKAVSVSLQQKLVNEAEKEEKLEDEFKDLKESFDEAKFNEIVKKETITKIVETLKTNVADDVKKRKNQIFSDYRYMMNVTCFKIPFCPKRMVKLQLEHSLISDDDDVCLIVKDLKRGMRVDYEPTIHYYEDLLREKGIKGIKAIMPFNQLKKEYASYEMKHKLSNTYDYFLCDGKISGNVSGFLGSKFRKSRCAPQPVRFNTNNLAGEIEKSMKKTSYRQGEKGTCTSIPVGHHKMSPEQVAENILCVISQLKDVYPGGLANIRSLYVRVNVQATTALPFYVSLIPPQTVPYIVGPKEENLKKLKEKANKILDKFELTNAGEIVRKRKVEQHNETVEEEPKLKKKKKIEKATELAGNSENETTNEKKPVQKDVKEALKKKENASNSKSTEKKVANKTADLEANAEEESDEDESEEEGSGEEESEEQGSDEEESEEVGSGEDESEEEGSDEEGNDEEGSDEEGSDEEGSDEEGSALEFESEDDDSDDDSVEDIKGVNEDESTEESSDDDAEDE